MSFSNFKSFVPIQSPQLLFYAEFSKNFGNADIPGFSNITPWDKIITNINNCYDPNTGKFTFPSNGIYSINTQTFGGLGNTAFNVVLNNATNLTHTFSGNATCDMKYQISDVFNKNDYIYWYRNYSVTQYSITSAQDFYDCESHKMSCFVLQVKVLP